MILKRVRVKKFRNILDTETEIEPDVTCLVGKNESGKTAFLAALDRLNPHHTRSEFDTLYDYPAWLAKRDRNRGPLENLVPIEGTFEVEDSDIRSITEVFGERSFESREITFSRNYGNQLQIDFIASEKAAVVFLMKETSLPKDVVKAKTAETFEEARTLLTTWSKEGERNEVDLERVSHALDGISSALGKKTFSEIVLETLHQHLPGFFYFDDYSTLPYSSEIKKVLKAGAILSPEERTVRSLLLLGGAEEDYMVNLDYEQRKRELENVANSLHQDVLDYWTTNQRLRVLPDITMTEVPTGHGKTATIDELKLRIYDERHSLSLPFDQHSKGFQWFFSFLAAFSEYQDLQKPVIILLDEPALGLHARAQKDFLRYIDERLARDGRQVIFTTHSPFMVQPSELHRVRMVEDEGKEKGTVVSADILSHDPDTLFPLQGALGYDIAQHLFVAEHNLVVEGTSDFTYLSLMSDWLAEQGRKHLDKKWSIVPVGGADLIPTFVALLGNHLNVTVIVDSKKGGNQRLQKLAADGYLSNKGIISIGEVLGKSDADIEDLFSEGDYLKLFNESFSENLKVADLQGSDAIVKRIARHLGQKDFDHGKPADLFLRRRDHYLPEFSDKTRDNFESLIAMINESLRARVN